MAASNPAYSWRARIEPEALALVLSIVVIAIVVGTAISGSLATAEPSRPQPSAAPTEPPPPPTPSAAFIAQGVALNSALVTSADGLEEVVANKKLHAPDIRDKLRDIAGDLVIAKSWADNLYRYDAGRDVAGSLQVAYEVISRDVASALQRSANHDQDKAWRTNATGIVALLRGLEPYEAQLGALGG
jgi:hypothetical protein